MMTSNSTLLPSGMLPTPNDHTAVHVYMSDPNGSDIRTSADDGSQVIGNNEGGGSDKLKLLWIPYVILTCIIVGLMAASFIRFHKKNSHKYQRRRMELLRQVNMHTLLNQIQDQVTHSGQLLQGQFPANGGPVGASVPVRFEQGRTTTTGSSSARRSSTKSSKSSKSSNKSNHHNSNVNHNNIGPSSGGNGNKTGKRHIRPLMFAHNSNGSMVDLRCVNRECEVKSPFQGPSSCPVQITDTHSPTHMSTKHPSSAPVIQTPFNTKPPLLMNSRGSRGSYSVPHGGEAYGGDSGSYNGGSYGGGPYNEQYDAPMSRDSAQYATPYAVQLQDTTCISEDQRLLMYQAQSKV